MPRTRKLITAVFAACIALTACGEGGGNAENNQETAPTDNSTTN